MIVRLGDRPDREHRHDDLHQHARAPAARDAARRRGDRAAGDGLRWTSERDRRRLRFRAAGSRHPRERMLITPLVAGVGGLHRVLRRRRGRRLAADPHVRPAGVERLGAALERGGRRPQPVRAERLLRVPLRATRVRRTCARRSTSSTRRCRSRATSTAATSPRTCSARSGPDPTSRRRRAGIPDDWQRAHFYDPRFMDPRSLMPTCSRSSPTTRSISSSTFVEQRSGKSGLLRYAGQLYAKHVVLVNQGFPPPYTGFQGAHRPIVEANEDALHPPSSQLEEAPNLSQIDRRLLARRQPTAGDGGEPATAAKRSSSTVASAATD